MVDDERLRQTGSPLTSRGWLCDHRAAALLLALVFTAFWPSLSGGFVYDDTLNFQCNAALREGDLWQLCTRPFFREHLAYWRPATSLLMALAYHAGGAFGVHALQLLVHAMATIAAWRLALRLLGEPRGAFAAAALFAVHPVQVESVAWASGLPAPLCGLFVLQAIRSTLHWRDAKPAPRPWRPAVWMLLALFAKEAGIAAVPLALLVVACLPSARPTTLRAMLWPMLIAAAVWYGLRTLTLGTLIGAPGSDHAIAFAATCAGVVEMLGHSLLLLIAPTPLMPFHALQTSATSAPLLSALPWLALLLGVGAALYWSWRRQWTIARIAALFVLLPLLLPALAHRTLGDYPLAERHLYVPAFGFAIGLAALAKRRPLLLALPVTVFAGMTFVQCRVWHDQTTFVAHCLRQAPADPTMHILAGNLYQPAAQSGDDAALSQSRLAYAEALRLAAAREPAFARKQLAQARAGIAWCDLLRQQRNGTVDAAKLAADFRTAIADDRTVVPAWVGLGVCRALGKQFGTAKDAFHRAIELDPLCAEAWFNLGYMQYENRQLEDAAQSLRQALRCNPDLVAARELLATMR